MHRLIAILFLFGLFSCNNEIKINKRFLITPHQVGVITDSTAVYQLKKLFSKDSIVARLEEGDYVEAPNDSYYIYTKAGKLRLVAIAKTQGDSTSSFKKISINDANYKLSNGFNKLSYYADLKKNTLNYRTKALTSRDVLLTFDSVHLNILYDKKILNNNWVNSASDDTRLVLKDSLQASEFYVIWE